MNMTQEEIEQLTPRQLKDYIRRGIITVMTDTKLPTTKEETPEYQQNAALAGQPIHVSAAARRYDIPQPTISRWVKLNYIKVLGMQGNKKMLDWADVAYCAAVYKKRQADGAQGKWLFDENGLPYVPETR